jgi:hypothetical protein
VRNIRDQLLDPDDLVPRFTREPIRGIGQVTREPLHTASGLQKRWPEGRRLREALLGWASCRRLDYSHRGDVEEALAAGPAANVRQPLDQAPGRERAVLHDACERLAPTRRAWKAREADRWPTSPPIRRWSASRR